MGSLAMMERAETPVYGGFIPDPERSVLVVESDPTLADVMVGYLREHDFIVHSAASARAMDAIMASTPIDLVMLDLRLPGEDGMALCRRVTGRGRPSMILLSAHDDAADRIIGLELGADDYLAKPFNMRELLARTRAVLRGRRAITAFNPDPARRRFAGLALDMVRQRITAEDGRVLTLTPAEFTLLAVFLEKPGRVLSRDELLDRAYGDADVFDRAVDVQISRLRQKLATLTRDQIIRTHRFVGYQFVARVE